MQQRSFQLVTIGSRGLDLNPVFILNKEAVITLPYLFCTELIHSVMNDFIELYS